MTDSEQLMQALDARAQRRESRRSFFTQAIGTVAAAAGTAALARTADAQTATPTPTPTPTPTSTAPVYTEVDLLNFALNLEYLEANYYSFAVNGTALAAADISGTVGTAGAATGGSKVTFTDPLVAQFATEIAADELAHVRFLRTQLSTLGIAQPAIDLGTGPFTTLMRDAGFIGAGDTFNPYAGDTNFLLGAYVFEDVGVTAYKGAIPLLGTSLGVEAAAGILAVEAYHAATIRSLLYRKALANPSLRLIEATEAISARRDVLDGSATDNLATGVASDDDQGIAPAADGTANIAPLNGNGLAFSRQAASVLNILYLNTGAVSAGGFFTAGVNGTIKTSLAAS
jgi:hypothetical protein